MKKMNLSLAAAAGLSAAMLAASAGAQCIGSPVTRAALQSSTRTNLMGRSYRPVVDIVNPNAVIVGMWHVKLTATQVSNGVPFGPGTEFDAGYQQWHSDGTEMLNSARPPITQSFCMGVWTQTGLRSFKLNHFAISWGPDGTRTGPTTITEEVTVSADGKTFSGRFTITDYVETDKPSGNSISFQDSIEGTITGAKIDANTAVSPIF